MKPRIREQALPEKDDDRFFDRWALDQAKALGSRAVKWSGLEKLGDGVLKFARWRSLRHKVIAERESVEDRETIASTQLTIEKAEGEIALLEPRAEAERRETERWDQEAEGASKARAELRPALRGARWWDLILCVLAQLVILTVDLFVFHRSLEQIPGGDGEHWGTAGSMGGGAVVVGDILGWLAAAGTVRAKGAFNRPRRPVVVVAAVLLILATWFFADLGVFRENALEALQAEDGVEIGKPSFFTLAQILFLFTASVSFFAYVARREGRDLHKSQGVAEGKRDAKHAEVASLEAQIAKAATTIADAPLDHEAATARLDSRAKVAEANAALDLEQGAYLYDLIVPEYMKARADVEIGTYRWVTNGQLGPPRVETWWLSKRLRIAAAVLATVAMSGAALLVAHSWTAAVFTGLIVAGALALMGASGDVWSKGGSDEEGPHVFAAEFPPPTEPGGDERSTDIVGLKPLSSNGHTTTLTRDRMRGSDEEE